MGRFEMLKILGYSSILALAACGVSERVERRAANDAAIFYEPCDAPASTVCAFVNSPVPLKPVPVKFFTRKNEFYPTAKPLEFIDARGQRWVAPELTLTDGASIPTVFVPMIGFPTSPEFLNAAAMHDAYCGIGNEKGQNYHSISWQRTHRMFYDALRVGGTSAIKAKIMFAAVYLGGPRWADTTFRTPKQNTRSRRLIRRSHTDISLLQSGLSLQELRQLFAVVKRYIVETNPTIQGLESYLVVKEDQAILLAAQKDDSPSVHDPYAPYDLYGP